MDADERVRRREERRKQREEESAAAETNGPTEEIEEEQESREKRATERAVEDDDSDRLRKEEEDQRQRDEDEAASRRQEEEQERERQEEQRRKEEAAAEKERKRNAEIERQRQEDLQREQEDKDKPSDKPKKKLAMFGRVSKGRKKEILAMLLKKARGDLQLEEQEAALEKTSYIEGHVKESSVESLNTNQLLQLCEELQRQLQEAEGEKFDNEIKVKRRDLQISNLKVKANETRGKFSMPTLKTVSKSTGGSKITERKDFRSDLKKAEPTAEN